jgi:hypothetical protein
VHQKCERGDRLGDDQGRDLEQHLGLLLQQRDRRALHHGGALGVVVDGREVVLDGWREG